jgi:hypothetical protein
MEEDAGVDRLSREPMSRVKHLILANEGLIRGSRKHK